MNGAGLKSLLIFGILILLQVEASTQGYADEFAKHRPENAPKMHAKITFYIASLWAPDQVLGNMTLVERPLLEDRIPQANDLGRMRGFLVVDPVSTVFSLACMFNSSSFTGALFFHGWTFNSDYRHELSVVGTSGSFRLASGYAFLHSYPSDPFQFVEAFLYK